MASQQTLRVTNLPAKIRESDLRNFFVDRIPKNHSSEHVVEVVGPICSHAYLETKQTTVTFSSKAIARLALNIKEPQRVILAEFEPRNDKASRSIIYLDETFRDLTTLYEPVNEAPDVDIVAVHGLSGQPWTSFMTTIELDSRNSKEVNWLRDILPSALAVQGIKARIMTYGYNANIWVDSNVGDIKTPVNTLVNLLNMERQKNPDRPLIFIGHSLGGIIVKQAIITMAKEAYDQKKKLAVKGCLFFAVPHKGAGIASDWSPILSVLGSAFGFKGNTVKDLAQKSIKLQDIAAEFRQVRQEHHISVTSCYELKPIARKIIVDKDSAILEYEGRPKDYGIDSDHRDIAKFRDTSSPHLLQIIRNIADIPLSDPVPPSAIETLNEVAKLEDDIEEMSLSSVEVEPKYALLDRFDTVFLVDDSGSMAGSRWQLVRQILETSTRIAMRHDEDGIDIDFFNSKGQENVKTEADVKSLFNNTRPGGRTPLGFKLENHLNGYIGDWVDAGGRRNRNYKQLNLIVLTDGEPNEKFDYIETVIVNAATELKQERAAQTQIGIQFCQIGRDADAVRFFTRLDNEIKHSHKLDRDCVDTVQCLSEADLTARFYRKLLTGAIDKEEDDEEVLPATGRLSSQDSGSGSSGPSSSPPPAPPGHAHVGRKVTTFPPTYR